MQERCSSFFPFIIYQYNHVLHYWWLCCTISYELSTPTSYTTSHRHSLDVIYGKKLVLNFSEIHDFSYFTDTKHLLKSRTVIFCHGVKHFLPLCELLRRLLTSQLQWSRSWHSKNTFKYSKGRCRCSLAKFAGLLVFYKISSLKYYELVHSTAVYRTLYFIINYF